VQPPQRNGVSDWTRDRYNLKGVAVSNFPEDGISSMAGEVTSGPEAINLLRVLWHRKGYVLLGLAIGLVFASVYFARCPPIYQSTAQVLVIKRGSSPLPMAHTDPRLSFIEDYVSTHLVMLRSPIIIERAVERRHLRALESLAHTGDPVGTVLTSINVSRDNKDSMTPSNIINLAYRGGVAEEAGTILAAVIDSYQEFLDETYRNMSDDTLKRITEMRDLLLKDLAEKDKAYAEFRTASPLLFRGKDGAMVQQSRIAELEGNRSKLSVRQAELKASLKILDEAIKQKRNRAELMALLPAVEIEQPKIIPPERRLEERLFPLILKEKELRQEFGFGPDHPQMQTVRLQIETIREQFQRMLEAEGHATTEGSSGDALTVDPVLRYQMRLRRELFETETRLAAQMGVLKVEEETARSLDSYVMKDEAYRNDIAKLNDLYDSVKSRVKEINLSRDVGGFDAKILARAGIGAKVAPSLTIILFAGMVMGLMGGMLLAYLVDLTDKGFRTPEEIRRRLGLPVLGHVPVLKPDEVCQQKVRAGQITLDPFLIACHRPKSLESEAFRAVRTALYFSTQGSGHQLIQITSPNQGDGKSITATNLAVSIAQSGKRVILVDADLRRPRQHKILGVTCSAGLAAVIDGQTSLEEAIIQTTIPKLSLLAAGPRPSNPSELLTSPQFQSLLATLRESYDFVLVDTPPLLVVTDPCVVAPRVDGVLLVIRPSKKSGPESQRAREILATLGVNVLGVVVNGASGSLGSGQYEYNYGPGNYSYEPDENEDKYYEEDAVSGSVTPAGVGPA